MKKNRAVGIVAIAVAAIVVIGAAAVLVPIPAQAAEPALQGTLTIAGSTTVMPICLEQARLMKDVHPGIKVSVSGGGSGHGVKAAGAGDIDIGMVSRDLRAEEIEMFPDLKPVVIGIDSVAIVVHPNNPVAELTTETAAKIFAGEITNWKEVGGTDNPIRIITREEGSGTRDTFEEFVMEPFERTIAGAAFVKPSNGEIRATVIGDELAIGYLSLGFLVPALKAVAIDGVEPTFENVHAGRYPIMRNLLLVTHGEPDELERAFIDFALGETGQTVVEEMGYMRVIPPVAEVPEEPEVPEVPEIQEVPEVPEVPGFGAVFAIAGLLAIAAYAMHRKRK
ncbi:MAG: phosphate ABC transporter substrate-binding protein [Methanophagales archaeon]|nr:phosphate ABC transporter substrate-binding protein [Methanophagales archaeon]